MKTSSISSFLSAPISISDILRTLIKISVPSEAGALWTPSKISEVFPTLSDASFFGKIRGGISRILLASDTLPSMLSLTILFPDRTSGTAFPFFSVILVS